MEFNDDVVSEIGRFAILWNFFENNYFDNTCGDKKIVQKSKKLVADAEKLASFRQVLHDRQDLYAQNVDQYIAGGLFPENARHTNPDFDRYMISFMNQGNSSDLTGCLLIICRIRNNLMHGLKDIRDLEGQLELFRAAGDVLESIRWNHVST